MTKRIPTAVTSIALKNNKLTIVYGKLGTGVRNLFEVEYDVIDIEQGPAWWSTQDRWLGMSASEFLPELAPLRTSERSPITIY